MDAWTTDRLLDAVKEKMGIESDYALARIWGVTPQKISQYRSGRTLSDDKAAHCAEFLELDPGAVLVGIHAERAAHMEKPELAAILQRAAINLADFARKAGKKAAAWLIFALALAGAPLPQQAQAAQEVSPGSAAAFDNNQNYANDLQIIRSYISGLMLLAATLATLAHRMLMV